MVILRTVVGPKRVELQKGAIILPTETLAGLSKRRRKMISNSEALVEFSVITWNGHTLVKITGAEAYADAFAQYQTRVEHDLNIHVHDLACIGCDA